MRTPQPLPANIKQMCFDRREELGLTIEGHDMQQLKNKISGYKKDIDYWRAEYLVFYSQLEQTESEWTHCQEVLGTKEAEIQNLELNLKEVNINLRDSENKVSEQENIIKGLSERVDNLEQKNSQLQDNINVNDRKTVDEEIRKQDNQWLKEELAQERAKKEKSGTLIIELEKEIAQNQNMMKTIRQQLHDLEEENIALKTRQEATCSNSMVDRYLSKIMERYKEEMGKVVRHLFFNNLKNN